jgi:hypothetical protein
VKSKEEIMIDVMGSVLCSGKLLQNVYCILPIQIGLFCCVVLCCVVRKKGRRQAVPSSRRERPRG